MEGAIFPITKGKLSLQEISDYWSREIKPPASKNELYVLLERAWWLGEIHGDKKIGRLQLLKAMFKTTRRSDDPGIVFIVCGETAPPEEKALPDGGVVVDRRPRVPLPSIDTDTWDIANCKKAFDAIAQTSSIESYHVATPYLMSIELTRDEFIRWLNGRDYQHPSFWSSKAISSTTFEKPKKGRPPEYNWHGVRAKLETYVSRHGPIQKFEELMQKCADFANELHPKNRTPSDKTIREAIKMHSLDNVAQLVPGK
jgi:hypothetical protein